VQLFKGKFNSSYTQYAIYKVIRHWKEVKYVVAFHRNYNGAINIANSLSHGKALDKKLQQRGHCLGYVFVILYLCV
jgi:hypothetical protein